MEFINTIIGVPLGFIMWLCFTLVKNYGIAILLFTLVTKALMFPLSVWVQKNSIKMIKLKPRLNEIAAAFAGNRDTVTEKQFALYKQENYKPLAGIIPLLIQIPIILGLITVVYNPLQHLLHIDKSVIDALGQKTMQLLGTTELGGAAHLKIIEAVNNPAFSGAFSGLSAPGAADAIAQIKALDLNFLGINLAATPSLAAWDTLLLIPLLSGASAFLLSAAQNKVNVLQREAGWLGRWGMAIFLTLFSLYFAFIVPAGVGLYWVFSNITAMLLMFVVNAMYPPKKYIDYEALEKSKAALERSKEIAKSSRPTAEQKARAKADYKRFFADGNTKQLVFYSEESGFYKYFKDVIEELLASSDIVIHYITGDPNDQIFSIAKEQPRIQPYYIGEERFIVLMMKMDADMVIMTMPDLGNYHIKRSFVRKDVEYVYIDHGPLSYTMARRKGCVDNFDTVFCIGPHHVAELREMEEMYGTPKKNLMQSGYSLIDNMITSYKKLEQARRDRPQVVIAPSWQEGNILESCIDPILESLATIDCKVVVRAHPQFMRHNRALMDDILARYADRVGEKLVFETNFATTESIFTSDVLISDWSSASLEFVFTTKKPCLLIDTPMKVINPDYDKFKNKPIDITYRDKVGRRLSVEDAGNAAESVTYLLEHKEEYRRRLEELTEASVFNIGRSAKVNAAYIIERLGEKAKQHEKEDLLR